MTSSTNETHKEPDRMSITRSSSLPENMLNIRSSSLTKNSPDTQSTSLSSNLPNTPLPSNLPNKRSASLPSLHSFDDERIKNDENKISRRYATYDLNWNSTDDHIDLENSIQSTLSDPIIIPSSTQEEISPSSPPIISSPISPISPISNDDYYNYFDFDKEEENYSFPGGITITTVKVVQVDKRPSIERASRIPLPKNKILYRNESNNTYNILKKQLTIKRQKKSSTNNNYNNNNNNNSISKQTIKERRKTKIYKNIDQNDIAQLKMINNINERKFNGVVRRSSSRRRLGGVHYRKSYKKRQFQSQERLVPAPTSNPLYTNDPTDMEGDDVILSPTTKGFPWLPVTNGPPKLLHASLVPLSQFIKNIETTPTVDVSVVSRPKSKRKSVESMSAPKPKRPSQLFRQNLLEQSIALSFNEMAMKSFASQPTQISKSTKSVQSINKPKRKSIESISAPKPKRPSQLFRENLLEQSVAMSFNEIAMGRNVLATQPTQSTQSARRSTKKLDQGLIESISEPEPKRPSQLFRENLLEQSVAMSLDEVLMGRNVFATHRESLNSKIPRRRFSRRGSNAKFRKEKSEKNKKGKNKKDDDNDQGEQIIQKTVNPMVISSILGDDELKSKVEEQLRKRAVLQSPQPPPRHFTPSTTSTTSTIGSQRGVIVRRRSKSTKLEKRLIKTEPLSRRERRERRDSVQLYPNHLAKRNKSLHWR